MDQQQTHHPGQSEAARIKCFRCGRAAHSEGTPLTWTYSMENGERRYFCDNCSRANIRAIEGRLDSASW
ncbi:hypothetical protein [Streptomyces albipurpureus]|uniref:Small CPxCG-related zinc finger protein n=1 Tax=Streptomyces albipurpureus TaxID=2897419 RepID=A0ABT0ULY5_9ACTN|nr:hypothetical protein [Streptomyces sp. CWNU-1]MCM2389034.1 hypothetical protein [Streptomyces sp. CWNU-1]